MLIPLRRAARLLKKEKEKWVASGGTASSLPEAAGKISEVRQADIKLKNVIYLSLLSCPQLDPDRSKSVDDSDDNDYAGFDILYDDGAEEMGVPKANVKIAGVFIDGEHSKMGDGDGEDGSMFMVGSQVRV